MACNPRRVIVELPVNTDNFGDRKLLRSWDGNVGARRLPCRPILTRYAETQRCDGRICPSHCETVDVLTKTTDGPWMATAEPLEVPKGAIMMLVTILVVGCNKILIING